MKKYAVVLNMTYGRKVIVEGVGRIVRPSGLADNHYKVDFGDGTTCLRHVDPDNICPDRPAADRLATTLRAALADA